MKKATMAGLLIVFVFSISAIAGTEDGIASYYADSLDGNLTASEEPYDRNALTAAHRTLAFGTKVKVTNLDNGKSVIVRINDRGPHTSGRIIDVSGAAADKLGLRDVGTAKVKLEILEPGK